MGSFEYTGDSFPRESALADEFFNVNFLINFQEGKTTEEKVQLDICADVEGTSSRLWCPM